MQWAQKEFPRWQSFDEPRLHMFEFVKLTQAHELLFIYRITP